MSISVIKTHEPPRSSVQRVLDAQAQRGSWMPTSQNNFYSSQTNFDLFLQITSKKFWRPFLVLSPNFYFHFYFSSIVLSGCPLSWMPGAVTFFLLIFRHLRLFLNICLHFFRKLHRWMPPAECPGPSHPRSPLCTPLPPRNPLSGVNKSLNISLIFRSN